MSLPQDQAEATFALQGEDHTMGNALRYMLNKSPHVAFAVSSLQKLSSLNSRRSTLLSASAGAHVTRLLQGYSVPHPSDEVVHIRVQTTGDITATQALRDAITGASFMVQNQWAHQRVGPSYILHHIAADARASLPGRSRRVRDSAPIVLCFDAERCHYFVVADLSAVCSHVRETFQEAVDAEKEAVADTAATGQGSAGR